MINRRKHKIFSALSLTFFIVGCGGSGQDDGEAREFSQTYSGVVVDGYLARATVFIDTNNNGTRDSWEPFAFTDNDGYYSFNPITNIDYCASTATAEQAQYCLVSGIEYTNVVIRIDGGYDISTGEPFLGQMSRRINAANVEETNDTVISPLSSLLTNVQESGPRTTLLSSLGLGETDLDVDYLNTDGAGSINPNLLNTALKVHKVVAVLSDRLTDTYVEIGDDFGTPNDASSSVYPNLAASIISSGMTLDQSIADNTLLTSVLDQAETQLRKVYERKEFDLPADMGSVSNPGPFSRVVSVAQDIASIVDVVIDANQTDFTLEDLNGGARALESVVIKAVNEGSNADTSIENAASFFGSTDNRSLVDALLQSLSQDTADVTQLSNNDFTGTDFDSEEEISAVAALPETTSPFARIGGMRLKVSDLDLGHAPNDLDDSEIELYFLGEREDVEGAFEACVKHIDGANVDGSLGEGNTRGELVSGFWSMLGASEQDPESYSLLITITFLGATYQAILKPAGEATVDDVEYQLIRFDNDGDIRQWHSDNGFVETVNIPSTNEDCEARLPSRVGI